MQSLSCLFSTTTSSKISGFEKYQRDFENLTAQREGERKQQEMENKLRDLENQQKEFIDRQRWDCAMNGDYWSGYSCYNL